MTTVSAIVPVYQDRDGVSRTVEALMACSTGGVRLDILVVDDGSTDGTEEHLREKFGPDLRIVRHERNRGRSAARNSGMTAAEGDYLLFLDADCIPASTSFVHAHLAAVQGGACSVGSLRSEQTGFWHRYQDVSATQKEARKAHLSLTFTSANFMISTGSMRAVGGFDEAYRGYGFEDRDLALRLAANGQAFTRTLDAVARHDDPLTLSKVCQKMEEAGRVTSSRFASSHPIAYRDTGYGRIDVRLDARLRLVHALTEWARPALIRASDALVERHGIPFRFRAAWTKVLVALSYMHGTATANPL